MPKNSKNEATNGSRPCEDGALAENVAPRAKKSARSATKKPARKVAAKKTGAKSATKSTPAAKTAPAVRAAEPTDAEINLRAYFLAEKRLQQHLPGDQAHDWLEARRQLRAEAGLV